MGVGRYMFFRVMTPACWRNILLPSSGSYSFLRLYGVVIQKTTVQIFTMKFSNAMRIAKYPTANVYGIVDVIFRHRKKSEMSSVVLCCNMNIKTKTPTGVVLQWSTHITPAV